MREIMKVKINIIKNMKGNGKERDIEMEMRNKNIKVVINIMKVCMIMMIGKIRRIKMGKNKKRQFIKCDNYQIFIEIKK